MPNLGDFGVTATGGWVARKIREITHSPVNHAFVYIGSGRIVEGEPHGAANSSVDRYPAAIWYSAPSEVGALIASRALRLVGTPYNYLDIAAQAVVRVLGWKAPRFVLARLSRSDRLQCAQLVDLAYHQAGVELFPDGRPGGLVAPSDLYDLELARAN